MAESMNEEELNLLKLKTEYYRAETVRMEAALKKLNIGEKELKMIDEMNSQKDGLNQIQKIFNTKEVTPNAVGLSYAHKLRKQNNYSAKLKVCLKMYIELNASLKKDICQLKSYEQAQKDVDQIFKLTSNDLQSMKNKITIYEQQIINFEKKHPWLKNEDYDLLNISEEINLLIAAKKEKEKLVEELDVYCGLKPNLQEATQQVSQLKEEYDSLCNCIK